MPFILADDPLVTRIGLYPTFSDAHLGFSIGLKEPAEYEVYELTDPIRTVIAVLYPNIRTIAQTLQFSTAPAPIETPTPEPPTAWENLPGLACSTLEPDPENRPDRMLLPVVA